MDSLIKFPGTAMVKICTAFGVLAAEFQNQFPQGSQLTLKQTAGRSLSGAQPPLLSGAASKLELSLSCAAALPVPFHLPR